MRKSKILFSVASIGVISIPIATAISCGKNIPTLTAKGSSTVLPFMQAFAKEYDKAQIQAAGGGSGAGQSAIIKGEVDFGNMSAKPDRPEIVGSEKFRTVTVGIDGLAMVVKGGKNKAKINDILTLYTEVKGNDKWLEAARTIFSNDATLNNVEVLSRENPEKSGTAEIFGIGLRKLAQTDKVSKHPKKDELKGVTSTTDEANSKSFESLKGSSKKYGITYLSLGIADSLIEGKSQFKKLTLTNEDGSHEMVPNKANVGSSYNWARPLNVIYNSKASNADDLVQFVKGMLEKGKESLEKSGYLSLSKEQLKLEGIDVISDKEFLESNKTNNHNGLEIDIQW